MSIFFFLLPNKSAYRAEASRSSIQCRRCVGTYLPLQVITTPLYFFFFTWLNFPCTMHSVFFLRTAVYVTLNAKRVLHFIVIRRVPFMVHCIKFFHAKLSLEFIRRVVFFLERLNFSISTYNVLKNFVFFYTFFMT